MYKRNWCSVIGIATVLQAGWSSVRIPIGGERFFSSQKRPHWLWGFVLGVKRLRGEVNHSHSSCAKVKNELSCTSAPPICLHGINREDLTFFTF
jgi:hypothetical protein